MDSKCIIHLLFIVMAIRHISSQQDAKEVTIVEQPQSLNITSGSDAHFTCKARAHIVQWRANGSVIDSDFAHSYSDGHIRISNLTLPADQVHKYNRARITCVAGSRTTASVESEPAFLLIQGVLDSPTEVKAARFNDSHITISWTAPFTLDITNLDPDITYCVYNNSNTPCMTTTNTSYIFEAKCSPVLYHVSACNPVGCSENATVMHPQVTIGFTLIRIEVMYGSDGDLLVHIHIQNDGYCFRRYSGHFQNCAGDSVIIDPITSVKEGKTHQLTLTPPDIVENARYTGRIESDGMEEVGFLTFDVQDVTATYTYEQDGYGDVMVTCMFARGTRALGCIVVFRNGPTTRNMPIMRSDKNSPTEASGVLYHLPNGEYEVIAYDLEFDGTSDMNCKPVKKTVTFPPSADPRSTSSTQSSTVKPTESSTGEGTIITAIIALMGLLGVVLIAVVVVAVIYKLLIKKKSQTASSTSDPPNGLSICEEDGPTPSQFRGQANPNSHDRQPDFVMPDGVVQKGLRHRRI